jgi:hypothetical protein
MKRDRNGLQWAWWCVYREHLWQHHYSKPAVHNCLACVMCTSVQILSHNDGGGIKIRMRRSWV